MIRTIAYWGMYGRAVSVIVLEDSKTPLGRKGFWACCASWGYESGMNRAWIGYDSRQLIEKQIS